MSRKDGGVVHGGGGLRLKGGEGTAMADRRIPEPRVVAAAPPGAPGGSWYTWWADDPLPDLPALPGFSAAPADDVELLADLCVIGAEETRRRLGARNRPYVARIGEAPVGYGWCTAGGAEIGELGISFTMAPRNRYLWGFATLPAWRGRGVYPRLLQAILAAEADEADRFWIGHEPGNDASARGILTAGFRLVGELYILPDGNMALYADGLPERGEAGATVLGVRELVW